MAQIAEAEALRQVFAKQGVLAIYGGSKESAHNKRGKGHGFWLYPASQETLARYEATRGCTHLDDAGAAILNDGKGSDNPGFWLFEDAGKLARHELCPSDGPCLLNIHTGHTTAF